MWKEWKDRLKNMILAEEEIDEIEQRHEILSVERDVNKPKLEARMTYQYPKDKAFKFPMIPDYEEMQRTRNRSERIEAQPNSNIERKQTPLPFRQKQKQQQKQQQQQVQRKTNEGIQREQVEENPRVIIKKDTSRPFQPTEVPSPIFGFHKRERLVIEEKPVFIRREAVQEKVQKKVPTEVPSPIFGFHKREQIVVEETPAFIRREAVQEKIQEESQESNQEEIQEEIVIAEAAAVTVEAVPEIIPPMKRNPIQSVELDTVKNNVEAPIIPDLFEMPVEDAQTIESEVIIEPEVSEIKPVYSKGMKEETDRSVNRTVEKETPIPFNVMMSANDKLHQEQKRQENFVKREVPIVEKQVEVAQEMVESYDPLPYHLLNDPEPVNNDDDLWLLNQQELLEKTLEHFNVQARVVNVTQGPSVTRFEVQPELGVKVSKVKNLSDDLKLNMSAQDIRIEAPIPGKNTIGIEIPNLHPQMVGLQEILESDAFTESESPLTIGLGLSIEGSPIITNIQKMPHGLIAGATGSGKSVCINTILISLLYKASHEDVKFLLIDPKMVELAPYNGIPHLVSPVITDVKAATMALKWAVNEMEERYEKFVREGVRDISRFNLKVMKQNRRHEKMPFLVIVIDELADLMMAAPQDVEDAICRIAQKARACGIHLLVATQRPSVDVITGLIKANIPTRIAFSVSSQIDSRTIIDTMGAERLLGKGDMLFAENGTGKTIRIQGAFVSDDEIERITNHVRTLAPPNYLFEQEQLLAQVVTDEDEDELLPSVIDFVVKQNHASTSLLQRNFRIGYNRAARLMDTLEELGIINGQNGSKPRDVLVSKAQMDELLS